MRRRELNRAALCLALGAWGLPRPAAAQRRPRWASDPFTLGVASGMPRPDSVVLWTRLAPLDEDDAERAARPACTRALRNLCRRGAAPAGGAGRAGHRCARAPSACTCRPRGLAPQREYWYRFTCGNATSPVGPHPHRAGADADVSRLRLALASCQNYEHGFFAAHRDIARAGPGPRALRGRLHLRRQQQPRQRRAPPHRRRAAHAGRIPRAPRALQARCRPAGRARGASLGADLGRPRGGQRLHRRPRARAHRQRAVPARRAAAYRAYFEHMPLALAPRGRVHAHPRPLRLGPAGGPLDPGLPPVPQPPRLPRSADGPWPHRSRLRANCRSPARTMLGAAQERWLAEGLAASGARWKLLGQSTQVSSIGLDTPQGRQTWTDGWDGYPLARERLLQGIADAGDAQRRHAGRRRAPLRRGRPARACPTTRPRRCVASEIRRRLHRLARRQPARRWRACAATTRTSPHARGDERGYALLDIGRERVQLRVPRHRDAGGAGRGAGAAGGLRGRGRAGRRGAAEPRQARQLALAGTSISICGLKPSCSPLLR